MLNQKELIDLALVAIQYDKITGPGGHLVFAYEMESIGVPVKNSVDAFLMAKLLNSCGEKASLTLTVVI